MDLDEALDLLVDGDLLNRISRHNADEFVAAVAAVCAAGRLVANGERMASYRDTDGFVKLHGSTMLDERGPGVDYLVVPFDRNLDSGGQTQVSESKLANGERVEPDYRSAAIEWIGEKPPDNYPGEWEQMVQTVIEQTVKPIVDAAVGGRLLVDPPKEEE